MTKQKNKWIAFFSQTGSEIVAISQALGLFPTVLAGLYRIVSAEQHSVAAWRADSLGVSTRHRAIVVGGDGFGR